MTPLKSALKELLGLFVEDEFLAVGLLCVVAGVFLLGKLLLIHSLSVGFVLLVGCVAVLVAGVWRTATHPARRAWPPDEPPSVASKI
jgi:hypothetical protein